MKKQTRFHIGDKVTWEGGPNELSVARWGVIVSIKNGIAKIGETYYTNHTREVPVKSLKLA